MKTCTMFRSRNCGPSQKVVLYLSLIGAGVFVFLPVAWAYQKIQLGIGREVAHVTLALQVFFILVLTTVGVGVAYLVDWSIRRRRFIFNASRQGSWVDAIVRLWGYEMKCQEEGDNKTMPESALYPNIDTFLDITDRPKHRGRKPTFPLERWLPIAAKWEKRDPIRDAFTLGELISAHLGQNLDGSPIVSEQTYYSTWRERAIEELQRLAEAKQATSKAAHDKPPE
jgi:hypothetical protein